ncbi:GH3 auxin-responsive promoter [Infundibulicybe gibba]|nr:GH3 auxin-responsive promoter [Infundibulicybe gibba]
MAPPSVGAPVLQTLSAQQVDQLKQRTRGILNYIVNTNSVTTYFRNAPLLARYRAELGLTTSPDVNHDVPVHGKLEVDFSTFTGSVPLSTYEDYRSYISRFLESPCLKSSVENLLAPGLPSFISTSSGTTGNSSKYFPKYTHPKHMSQATATSAATCVPGADGGLKCAVLACGVAKTIPFSLATAGTFRNHNGWSIDNDKELVKTRPAGHVTPAAVAFIKPYYTFLLLHALFAMSERSLASFHTLFITVFSDLVRLIENHWEELVRAIEIGQIPDLDGLGDLRPHIQAHFQPHPDRAEELRKVGVNMRSAGWLKKIWPNLTLVAGNTTGSFSAVLPRKQVRDYVGPTVSVQSVMYASSEAWIGVNYGAESGDSIYKTLDTDDVFEYLDIEKPESAEHITQAWDLQVGKKYELILTTREGFWRYRLGDVLEIAGFAPEDGSPLIRFLERRNAIMRISEEFVSEAELRRAVKSIEDIIGPTMEFSVVVDDRKFPRRYGFLLELDGEPGTRAHTAPRRLQDYLSSTNDTYARFSSDSKIGVPSVRILGAGTFSAYRSWRIGVSGGGSGQTKVPIVLFNPEARDWLARHAVKELGEGLQEPA